MDSEADSFLASIGGVPFELGMGLNGLDGFVAAEDGNGGSITSATATAAANNGNSSALTATPNSNSSTNVNGNGPTLHHRHSQPRLQVDHRIVDHAHHSISHSMNVNDIFGASKGAGADETAGANVGTGASIMALHHQQMHHSQHQQQQQQQQAALSLGAQSQNQNQNSLTQTALSLSASLQNQGSNLDALQQLLAMQLPLSSDTSASGVGGVGGASTTALLEQQLRLNQLQQLQQLQNQIFQQQIELISGQSNLMNSLDTPMQVSAYRDQTQSYGLPTPINSTEIRAQPTPNFVSPMILQNYITPPGSTPMSQFAPSHPLPQAPNSAPAHLAFSAPLTSPSDLDLDLSPITSPWLDAYQHPPPSHSHPSQPPQSHSRISPIRSGTKRGASSSGGEESVSAQIRKRQSPAIRPINSASASTGISASGGGGGSGTGKKQTHARGAASLGSTPASRSRSRKGSIAGAAGDMVGDTPSPVDLSMPPPAPPAGALAQVGSDNLATDSLSGNAGPSVATPSSIMNLGRLGLSSGLSSPLNAGSSTGSTSVSGKRKSPPKIDSTTASSSTSTTRLKKPLVPIITPGTTLKPLLPGGLPPSSVPHLAAAPNYTHHLSGTATSLNITPTTPLPQPTLQVRKTSHKAAEQKRRDSLKTSFDDLRLLLPPIPLPSEEGYDGEPPLPGAMPPRGPPRGEVNGPNRAVSKLQLLRCGNDFIRRLKGRVTRRDEYIEQLKTEVRMLREKIEVVRTSGVGLMMDGEGVGGDGAGDEVDMDEAVEGLMRVDLDRDIDAEEANAPKLGGVPLEGDEDEDGGE